MLVIPVQQVIKDLELAKQIQKARIANADTAYQTDQICLEEAVKRTRNAEGIKEGLDIALASIHKAVEKQ